MGFYALVKPLDLPEPETTSPVVAHLPLMRGLEALAITSLVITLVRQKHLNRIRTLSMSG